MLRDKLKLVGDTDVKCTVTTTSNLVRLYMDANRNEPPLPLNEDSSDASLDLLISRIRADKKKHPEKYARRFRENEEQQDKNK